VRTRAADRTAVAHLRIAEFVRGLPENACVFGEFAAGGERGVRRERAMSMRLPSCAIPVRRGSSRCR